MNFKTITHFTHIFYFGFLSLILFLVNKFNLIAGKKMQLHKIKLKIKL